MAGDVAQAGDGGWNKWGSALNGIKVNTAFGRFSYELSDTTTFYVNATASEATNRTSYFPIKIGPVTFGGLYYRNNPFLPAATQVLLGNNGTNPAFFVPSTGTQP